MAYICSLFFLIHDSSHLPLCFTAKEANLTASTTLMAATAAEALRLGIAAAQRFFVPSEKRDAADTAALRSMYERMAEQVSRFAAAVDWTDTASIDRACGQIDGAIAFPRGQYNKLLTRMFDSATATARWSEFIAWQAQFRRLTREWVLNYPTLRSSLDEQAVKVDHERATDLVTTLVSTAGDHQATRAWLLTLFFADALRVGKHSVALVASRALLTEVDRIGASERRAMEDLAAAMDLVEEAGTEAGTLHGQLKDLRERPPTFDFATVRKALEQELEALGPIIGELEDAFIPMGAWIEESRAWLKRELRRRRVVAGPDQHEAIRRAGEVVELQILERVRTCEAIEVRLSELNTRRQRLDRHLKALVVVERGVQGLPDLDLEDVSDLGTPAVADLLEEALVAETRREPAALTSGVVQESGELPYSILVSAGDVERVRAYEQAIADLSGFSDGALRAQIQRPTEDRHLPYYEGLIDQLREGTLLRAVRRALVLLNATREGDEPKARLSNTVGDAMLSTGLTKFTGPERKQVAHAFMHAWLLGQHRADLALTTRITVGSRWGLGNKMTPLGIAAANRWTADLVESGEFTTTQLGAVHQYIQNRRA